MSLIMELRMMKTFCKTFARLTIFAILFCLFSLPCFAALRRVPTAPIVEQGLTAVTVDAEGAENFRYVGEKDKMHTYVGKIQPGSKLKFVIRVTLQEEKELPITGRTCLVRMQVTARKGDTVIKTQNYRKENMVNLYLNYTVPEGADTLEVVESFALTNKSKESKFNQKVTTLNKLVLSAREEVLAAAAGNPEKDTDPDKKATAGTDGKKTSDGKDSNTDGGGKNTGKPDGKDGKSPDNKADVEAKERFTRIVSGTALLVLLAGVGTYFFLKNRRSDQTASDKRARKERLRLQAVERQKQLRKNSSPEETREEPQRTDNPLEDTLPQDDPQQDLSREAGPAATAAAGVTQPLFCQNCGAPLKPGSKFCESCGTKV